MKPILLVVAGLLLGAGCGDDNKVTNNDDDGGPAPNFEVHFGGNTSEEGRAVIATSDGGFIAVGSTDSYGAGNFDIYVVKTDKNGDSVWSNTFGGDFLDLGFGVAKAADGGYVVMGLIQSFGAGSGDIYLVKIDENGDSLWANSYGGSSSEEAWAMQATSDGYIIAGRTRSFGAGGFDIYLIKTDLSGEVVWTQVYGGTEHDNSQGVIQTSDGGYLVVGQTQSFGATASDVYLIRTDANGDSLWTKTYASDGEDYGQGVIQTSDGGFMVAGSTNSSVSAGSNFFLMKTDTAGVAQWTKYHGGPSGGECHAITATNDGGFVMVGNTTFYGAGSNDVYLIKTDAAGDTLWTRTYGGTLNDYGFSISATTDGGLIVVGATSSLGTGGELYLLKLDGDGNL